MPVTDVEKNSIATKYGVDAAFLSLHSADPSTTGANEISGGSPAYARQAPVWGSASGGVVAATVTFDVPASTTVAFVGVWSAVTGGTYLDKAAVTSQQFISQGQYLIRVTATAT